MATHWTPDGMPVLSRGKHRTPRKGACFMEMASVLANEPWSDHPACTHPLLAGLARLVNDHTTDRHRGELAVLIPSVVGLRGGGLGWEVGVSSAVAAQAIPDVPEPSQRALAAGLFRCRELADSLGPEALVEADVIRQALDRVPGAVAWARRHAGGSKITEKQFTKRCAPTIMRCAVTGLASSATPDPDERLRELLRVGIATAERLAPRAPLPAASGRPQPVRS